MLAGCWMAVVSALLEVAAESLAFEKFAHERTVTNRHIVPKTPPEGDGAVLCGRDTRTLATVENTAAGMNKEVLYSTSCWYSLVSSVVEAVSDHSAVERRRAAVDRSNAEDTTDHKAVSGCSPEDVAPQKVIAVDRTMTGSPFHCVPFGELGRTACFGIQLAPDAARNTRLGRQNSPMKLVVPHYQTDS